MLWKLVGMLWVWKEGASSGSSSVSRVASTRGPAQALEGLFGLWLMYLPEGCDWESEEQGVRAVWG